MHVKASTRSADQAISDLAGRQHGVVSRQQLLQAGITREQISVRLESSRLTPLHRGVYLVGAVGPRHANEMAALLVHGPDSALSDRTATALWDLLPYPPSAHVWITVASGRKGRRPGIEARRADLAPEDVRIRHRMRITSPPRTVLDMAALLDEHELEHLVAEARFRRLAFEHELRDQLERNPGKRGAAKMRAVLDLPGGPRRTRSPAERELLRLLRGNGIEGYETNVRVAGYEVDFLWRAERLVIEVDGWDGHSGQVAFERDRLKVATLRANGLSVMPVTGRQIRRDPHGVVGRIRRALTIERAL